MVCITDEMDCVHKQYTENTVHAIATHTRW